MFNDFLFTFFIFIVYLVLVNLRTHRKQIISFVITVASETQTKNINTISF